MGSRTGWKRLFMIFIIICETLFGPISGVRFYNQRLRFMATLSELGTEENHDLKRRCSLGEEGNLYEISAVTSTVSQASSKV